MTDETFEYDVFISYSHQDKEWVRKWLLPRLDKQFRVCIDFRDFRVGVSSIENMEWAVESSRRTLPVFTPSWVDSEWARFEEILTLTRDVRRGLVPVMLEDCELPLRLRALTCVDFRQHEHWEAQFERVVAAIRKEGPTGSSLHGALLPLPPQPHFAHPYPLQQHFTGRVREREMLTQWLTEGADDVFALTAIGGMGKSALTWVWTLRDVCGLPVPGLADDPADLAQACAVPEDARPDGVLWWSFYEAQAGFEAFLDEAVRYVGGGEIDPESIRSGHEKVQCLLSLLQERRVLLVLDGFERELRAYHNMNAAYAGDALAERADEDARSCIDLRAAQLLRGVASLPLAGRVLITSRLFPRELDGMAGFHRESLEGLQPADAVVFFRAWGIEGMRAEIEAVCEPWDYHPLALRVLAGFIARDYRLRGDVQAARRHLDEVLPELKGAHAQTPILRVAYDSLDAPTGDLLSRIAAFRGRVDYDALLAISEFENESALEAALHELEQRGLLMWEDDEFDLHPIVRQYAYDRLSDPEGVHEKARDYFDARPKPDTIESVDDLAPTIELYHHTVRAGRYHDAFKLLYNRLHDQLYYQLAAYSTSIEMLRELFPETREAPRLSDQSAQAWTLNALAVSYTRCGQTREAVVLLEASAVIHRASEDNVNLAISLANLAEEQRKLGELAKTEADIRRQIHLCDEQGDAFNEATGHAELGCLLAHNARWDEAADELNLAWESFEGHGEVQGQCIVVAHCALRALLMGELDEALGHARHALVAPHRSIAIFWSRCRAWDWRSDIAVLPAVRHRSGPASGSR
ncbi:MAG: toll/interleukin-1 receptor domain-containing protein, partial [Armatimonadota bacterium]|nr:toll/interleukin-1 receptor domain-containing protein [Armatimonadota bacterium]